MTTLDCYVRFIPAGVGSIHNPRRAPFDGGMSFED